MELNDLSGAARIVLHPMRYEFESVIGDNWDDNWLVIAGEVVSGGVDWSFRDPSLTADEAIEIADWLERVATRLEAPADVSENGGIDPSLAFTEPNLAFSVQSYGEDTVVVRVHLSLEELPPDRRGPEVEYAAEPTFWVEIEITLTDAVSAAATWRSELAVFPRR
ncbi:MULTISPECIES: hypothetical protein [unclassified Cryobacterium]|uniref:WapI family immunity protein n=1 Tax=unclassified Cryobacterium TaxID=2649013 RepID=UPI00106B600F|nr:MULTISPECIES: hypothetical protein [unclassified Cryobacterium]TFC06516.1 hypothetical protein E3O59_10090 [Cryobacterium sp. MDB2-33-2]TFC12531.1 hypothetical protein E3O51_18320 [Cryobacterium sp. MDB2-10]